MVATLVIHVVIWSSLLINRPQRDGRLSLPGWSTHSGHFLTEWSHVNRRSIGESLPSKDRRRNHWVSLSNIHLSPFLLYTVLCVNCRSRRTRRCRHRFRRASRTRRESWSTTKREVVFSTPQNRCVFLTALSTSWSPRRHSWRYFHC